VFLAPRGSSALARERAQAWQDNEQDATAAGGTPADLGATFGARWVARATRQHREALVDLRPRLPRHLDGELLRYAEKQGVDTRAEDEVAKHAVRAGFWTAVAEAHPPDDEPQPKAE
jgi:hypothetical protein